MLIWPILKPLSLEKGEPALDCGAALLVPFSISSALVGSLAIDSQLQCLRYSIKFPANFAKPRLFRCRPYGFR